MVGTRSLTGACEGSCVEVGRQGHGTRTPRAMMAGARPSHPINDTCEPPQGVLRAGPLGIPTAECLISQGTPRLTRRTSSSKHFFQGSSHSTRRFLMNSTPIPTPAQGWLFQLVCIVCTYLTHSALVDMFLSSPQVTTRVHALHGEQNLASALSMAPAWCCGRWGSLRLTSPWPSYLHPYGVV